MTFPEGVSADDLVDTVRQAGYDAAVPRPRGEEPEQTAAVDPVRSLRQRLIISTVLTVPVIAMAMVPALQFTNWQWLSLTLAAPVVVWGAWPFHKAAWTNLRHGTSTMDTLISMGTLAALGWSLYALFWGTAGTPGMTHPFELTVERTDGAGNIYFEAAAGVTTFILAGRYFEARSKRRAGAALRALLELGAKDVAVLRDGRGRRVRPGSPPSSWPSATCSSSGPARRSPPTASSRRATSAVDASMLTGESVPVEVGAGDAVVGATVNAGGRLRRPRHPGRRGHPARADGPAGRGRAERQGRGAAARRPGLRHLRADRDRPGRRDPRVLARHRRRAAPRRSPPPWPC